MNNVSKTTFSAVTLKDRNKQKLGKADSKQQKGNGEEVINKPLTFLLPFTKMSSAFWRGKKSAVLIHFKKTAFFSTQNILLKI